MLVIGIYDNITDPDGYKIGNGLDRAYLISNGRYLDVIPQKDVKFDRKNFETNQLLWIMHPKHLSKTEGELIRKFLEYVEK